jgi:hypothetical protein
MIVWHQVEGLAHGHVTMLYRPCMISTNQTYLAHSHRGCKPPLRDVRLMLRVAGKTIQV